MPNNKPLNVLTFTTLFPNKHDERHGIFISNRLKELIKRKPVNLVMIAPVPIRGLPSLRFNLNSKHDDVFKKIYRPKYLSIPGVNKYFSPFLIFFCTFFTALYVIRKYKIDVIDSHYLYPDAIVALLISKLSRRPLVVTARGSDINYWPNERIPRYYIKKVLKGANSVCAVSSSLATRAARLIEKPIHVNILPNGIDPSVFFSKGPPIVVIQYLCLWAI